MKHLGSLESTQEARVARGVAKSNSYASFVLSKLPAWFIILMNASADSLLLILIRELRHLLTAICVSNLCVTYVLI